MPRVTATRRSASPEHGTVRPWLRSAPTARVVGLSLRRRARRRRDRGLAAGDAVGRVRAAAGRPAPGRCRRQRRRRQADALERRLGHLLPRRARAPGEPARVVARRASRTARRSCRPQRSCRPAAARRDLDRVDRLTFADSRTVAGVVALRALGRKVTVERTGVTFDGVDRSAPAYRAGLRPGMVITAIDGVAVPQLDGPARRRWSGRKPGSPIHLTRARRQAQARAAHAR